MAEAEPGAYSITWESKPLGFSIVMDTTGNNAYVSSIQKSENVANGLKLAAQIIRVNKQNTKDIPHNKILETIKRATPPITLTFQPRSFANNPDASKQKYAPFLSFAGAITSKDRINGGYVLVDGAKDNVIDAKTSLYNGKPVWRRVPTQDQAGDQGMKDDPIYCWFWPETDPENKKATKGTGVNMWMISRGSQLGKGGAYACVSVEGAEKVPTDIEKTWKVYDKDAGSFVDSTIKIQVSKQ